MLSNNWLTEVNFLKWVPYMLQISLVLLVGFFANKLLNKYFSRFEKREKLDRRLVRQIGLTLRYVIYLFLSLIILSILGITPSVLLAGLGIIGIAAGLAAQDILSNVLNGIFLIFEGAIKVSDVVKIGDVYGIVRLVKLRTTEIRTFDNNIVNIPNSVLSKNNIVNMTSGGKYLTTSITLKLAYEADYDACMDYMKTIASQSQGVTVSPRHGFKFEIQNIGERYRGLYLTMFFFVEAANEPWIRSNVHQKIIEKLVEENVPFHKDAFRES